MTMTMKLQNSQETTMVTQKQGIVTILGCATETNTASASSLRRTLSADMSSIKWLPQNGSFMKRNSSSENLKTNIADNYEEEAKEVVVDGEAEAERERLEIWSSIQRNKKEEQEKEGTLDTWSSLLSLKSKDEISKSLPATPYIHPLVKTKSSLSEKSLEICTESLGSETGSDGLVSSYPPSETEDSEEEKEQKEEKQEEEKVKEEELPEEEEEVVKYNYHVTTTTTTKKSSSPRSFPPPLPSLSSQTGPSLHMRPYRDNGRLVLEAVSLPSQNNFCVQRQDGRLVLTFANTQQEEVDENIEKENDAGVVIEELEEEFEAFEEEKDDEDEDEGEDEYEDDEDGEESETVMEKEKITNASVNVNVNVNRLLASSKVVNNNKAIGLVNRNPKWSEKFNEVVNFKDVDVVETTQMVQSLPPRPPRVARLIPSPQKSSTAKAAAASFNINAYENYWRTKSTGKDYNSIANANSLVHQQVMNNDYAMKKNSGNKIIVSGDMNQVSNEKQQLLVLRGKNGDYLVHNLKSCKDSRRSFLFWEPYCIATS